jgi:hypothetical protein
MATGPRHSRLSDANLSPSRVRTSVPTNANNAILSLITGFYQRGTILADTIHVGAVSNSLLNVVDVAMLYRTEQPLIVRHCCFCCCFTFTASCEGTLALVNSFGFRFVLLCVCVFLFYFVE